MKLHECYPGGSRDLSWRIFNERVKRALNVRPEDREGIYSILMSCRPEVSRPPDDEVFYITDVSDSEDYSSTIVTAMRLAKGSARAKERLFKQIGASEKLAAKDAVRPWVDSKMGFTESYLEMLATLLGHFHSIQGPFEQFELEGRVDQYAPNQILTKLPAISTRAERYGTVTLKRYISFDSSDLLNV